MHTRHSEPPVTTFSIVARDPATGDLGIAVESKFIAVGAVVPWARAGVGAIATQAWANVSYGPRGLDLLAAGLPADAVVAELTGADDGRDRRQVGVVDAQGRAASFTGPGCSAWAGGLTGAGFCCQGNILAGPAVVEAMAAAYRDSIAPFAERLVAALRAGQAAGGDRRGQQAAALLVVRERGGYGGGSDRYIDLRVDDHPQPIEELARLLRLHQIYFGLDDAETVPLDPARLGTVRAQLHAIGYLPSPSADDEATRAALASFAGNENLEERLRDDDQIDTVILEFLRDRAAEAR